MDQAETPVVESPATARNDPWKYSTAADVGQDLVGRLRNFPREPDMSVYAVRMIFSCFLRCWLRLYNRLEVEGVENLPRGEDSYAVIANHASHMDTLCLLGALPIARLHQTYPAAAADYFFEKAPHTLVAGALINALPFDRLNHKRESLELCRWVLEQTGNRLILFPEGTRSGSATIDTFKPGIGYLTAGSTTAVVPCHLDGMARALPKGAAFPRPSKLRVRFGHPRSFEDYQPSRESGAEIARVLQRDVEELAGLSPDV